MALFQRSRYSILVKNTKNKFFVSKNYNDAISLGNESSVKPYNRIPGPLRLPIWGSLYLYKIGKYSVDRYHEVLQRLHKQYGSIVREDFGNDTIIHVFHPDDIKTVYAHEDAAPIIAPLLETTRLYRKKNDIAQGLGNVNGEEWYRLRKAVRSMMLRPQEVHHFLPKVQEITQEFVKHLDHHLGKNSEVYNLKNELTKWQLETSGMICFEKRMGAMSGDEREVNCQAIIDANKTIFRLAAQLKFSLPVYRFIMTPKWKQFVEAEDFVCSTTKRIVDETIHDIKCSSEKDIENGKYRFMVNLLSKNELTMNNVTMLAFSLFVDGLTSVVPAILFNLYCIASNPEVQDNVHKEISSLLKCGDDITVEVFDKLQYLKAVVKETHRYYPIGTEISRFTKKDMVLSGFHIPAGTHVHLSPEVHSRSEEWFSAADQFMPERWMRDAHLRHPINPHLLIPFGHGTRTCAGRRFAEQSIIVMLCLILQKFKIACSEGERPLGRIYNTLLTPDRPVRIQFSPRT